jgi:RecA-family ATPase
MRNENQKIDLLFLDNLSTQFGPIDDQSPHISEAMQAVNSLCFTHEVSTVVLHHQRKAEAKHKSKNNSDDYYNDLSDSDSIRGSSKIVNAARAVITLTLLDPEMAKKKGFPNSDTIEYVRLEVPKSNNSRKQKTRYLFKDENGVLSLFKGDTYCLEVDSDQQDLEYAKTVFNFIKEIYPKNHKITLNKIRCGTIKGNNGKDGKTGRGIKKAMDLGYIKLEECEKHKYYIPIKDKWE